MSRNAKIAVGCLASLVFLCAAFTISSAFVVRYAFTNSDGTIAAPQAIVEELVQTQIEDALDEAVVSEPEAMQQLSAEIADFVLPEGYKEIQAISMLGVNAVVYGGEGAGARIALAEIPESLAQGMESTILELLSGNMTFAQEMTDQEIPTFTVVEERPVILGGSETTLRVLEAEADGRTIRQMNALYDGDEGMMNALIIAGFTSTWDEAAVNEFISSLQGSGR